MGDPEGTGRIADTHNAWYLSPQEYTDGVDSILDTMEENRKRKEAASAA